MLERAEVDGSSWSAETDGRWYLSRFSPLLGVLYRLLELTICHHGHETVLQRVDSRLLNHKGRIVHYPMCTDCRLIGSFLFSDLSVLLCSDFRCFVCLNLIEATFKSNQTSLKRLRWIFEADELLKTSNFRFMFFVLYNWQNQNAKVRIFATVLN